jgi:hypothetical protein
MNSHSVQPSVVVHSTNSSDGFFGCSNSFTINNNTNNFPPSLNSTNNRINDDNYNNTNDEKQVSTNTAPNTTNNKYNNDHNQNNTHNGRNDNHKDNQKDNNQKDNQKDNKDSHKNNNNNTTPDRPPIRSSSTFTFGSTSFHVHNSRIVNNRPQLLVVNNSNNPTSNNNVKSHDIVCNSQPVNNSTSHSSANFNAFGFTNRMFESMLFLLFVFPSLAHALALASLDPPAKTSNSDNSPTKPKRYTLYWSVTPFFLFILISTIHNKIIPNKIVPSMDAKYELTHSIKTQVYSHPFSFCLLPFLLLSPPLSPHRNYCCIEF